MFDTASPDQKDKLSRTIENLGKAASSFKHIRGSKGGLSRKGLLED